MAHISLPDGIPGIRGPMMFRPETAKPLNELVDVQHKPIAEVARNFIATLQ